MDQGRTARLVERLDPVEDLNYRHFRMRHMVAELFRPGVAPGSQAPDFDLATTDGHSLRLSDLRGEPVLLHFVSYTCPVTRGGVATMKELHRLYGHRIRFVEMVVRQAHPGGRHGGYRSYEAKLADGRAYQREEQIPRLSRSGTGSTTTAPRRRSRSGSGGRPMRSGPDARTRLRTWPLGGRPQVPHGG